MKARNRMALLASAAFVAATLQGSRLPEDAVSTGTAVAQAASAVDYRSGSGADKDEFPPFSDSVFG